jgi:hypothetical protein
VGLNRAEKRLTQSTSCQFGSQVNSKCDCPSRNAKACFPGRTQGIASGGTKMGRSEKGNAACAARPFFALSVMPAVFYCTVRLTKNGAEI